MISRSPEGVTDLVQLIFEWLGLFSLFPLV